MLDYLDWQSDLTLESVFAGSEPLKYPHLVGHGVIYLTTLNEQQGRQVLMYREQDNKICLTPSPYNLRSQISEYGGKPFWIFDDKLIFVDQADQCLYLQELSGSEVSKPVRISPELDPQQRLMYGELVMVAANKIVVIVEQAFCGQAQSHENQCFIATIAWDDLATPNAKMQILESGADFYSNLALHQSSQKLAWVQWQHPNMPWDANQLWVGDLVEQPAGLSLQNSAQIHLRESASVCQVFFANSGRLFFSADFEAAQQAQMADDFWNVYCIDLLEQEKSTPLAEARVQQVTDLPLEFGYPHWQYGDVRIVQLDESHLLAFGSGAEGDTVYRINQHSLQVDAFEQPSIVLQNLSADGSGQAVAVLMRNQSEACLAKFKLSDSVGGNAFNALFPVPTRLVEEDVSVAQHIEFPTSDGSSAFGYFYPPTNPQQQLATDPQARPPLLVMVHGGPTARAYGFLDLQKQFWTQRGFAILDVNHRGSSGYGRAFRDALYGNWGVMDAADIVSGIQHLIQQGCVDPQRICIRGKSAGGYAVLRALTEYPQIFKAGACYYGIGNLLTLAETTHKFEKYYTDRMIGERYDPVKAKLRSSLFQQRSPINKLAKLTSAMIVFQGLQDKVVPPTVAHEIVDVLKSQNLPYSYVEYADEGHGFRQVANNIDAWNKEFDFYRTYLSC